VESLGRRGEQNANLARHRRPRIKQRPEHVVDIRRRQRIRESERISPRAAINNNLLDITPIVAIDFDHVAAKGESAPEWVADVCAEIGSFTERSISGTGFHTFVYGELPKSVNTITGATIEKNVHGGDQKVELFNHKMVVVTGECLPGMTAIKPASTEKLLEIGERARAGFGRIKKPVASVATSLVLTDRLMILERGESPGGDASESDKEYVALLAEQGLPDDEIDARFRASARMRAKWDEKRGDKTYGERTIAHVRKSHAAKLTGKPDPTVNPDDWRGLFHSYDEALHAPPLSFAIDGFLQEDGLTFFGGLAGHGKTLLMLNVAKSLIEGTPLFGYSGFPVLKPAKRVLYLVPESGLGPFVHRLKLFGLLDHVKDGKLFFRTMTAKEQDATLADARLLKAVEGADVFLDTAIRFSNGEENSASDNRAFAKMLFNLQAVGARSIAGAHHSPKGFENRESITLDNTLRGSGDIGAMLATCWAVRQTDAASNRIFMKCVKARDFEPCQPFEVQGRPFIEETGAFKMVAAPGTAGLRVAPKPHSGSPQITFARAMRKDGKTLSEIATALNVTERTVQRWSSEGKLQEPQHPQQAVEAAEAIA